MEEAISVPHIIQMHRAIHAIRAFQYALFDLDEYPSLSVTEEALFEHFKTIVLTTNSSPPLPPISKESFSGLFIEDKNQGITDGEACTKRKLFRYTSNRKYIRLNSNPNRISALPSIINIVSDLFSKDISRPCCSGLIWKEAGDFYRVSLSFVLQKSFNHMSEYSTEAYIGKRYFLLKEIKQELSILLNDNMGMLLKKEGVLAGDIVTYYLEILLNLQLVYFFDAHGPKRGKFGFRTRLTPIYLLTQSLGLGTGVRGLDHVLGGGLLLPPQGASGVVTGLPGSGKSTLCLSIAVHAAIVSGYSTYISLEMDSDVIAGYVAQYRTKELKHLSMGTDIDTIDIEATEECLGSMIVPDSIIANSPKQFLDTLGAFLKRLNKKIPTSDGILHPRIIIIDAINGVLLDEPSTSKNEENKPITSLRELVVQSQIIAKDNNFSPIFILETEENNEFESHEQFVVDFVLETSRGNDVNQGSIRCVKSRYQPTWPGKSAIRFDYLTGIQVAPDEAHVFFSSRERHLTGIQRNRSCWYNTFDGWSKYVELGPETQKLEKKDIKGIPRQRPTKWWHSNSVTAIIGPRHAQRSDFVGTLLKIPTGTINQKKPVAHIHLVLGRENMSYYSRSNNQKLETSPFAFGTKLSSPSKSQNREIYLVFTLRYVRTSQIIWSLYETIQDERREGRKINMCALYDVSTLDHDFEQITEQNRLLTTFVELCRSFAIEPIIASADDPQDIERSALHKLEHIADNIIELSSCRFGSKSIDGFKISKSISGEHPNYYYEIEYNKVGHAFITGPVPEIKDIINGQIHTYPTRLLLYADTNIQTDYKSYLFSVLTKKFNDFNITLSGPEGTMEAHSPTIDECRISQTDSYEATINVMQEIKNEIPYMDLSIIVGGEALLRPFQIKIDEDGNYFPDDTKYGEQSSCYYVPYFLNPSLLALRDVPGLKGYDPSKNSWEWLLKRAYKFINLQEEDKKYNLFSCSLNTPENYNSLFLEILYSCLYNGKKSSISELLERSHKNDTNEGLNDFFKKHKKAVYKATLIFVQLLSDCTPPSSNKCEGEPPELSTNALIYRCWYSAARQLVNENVLNNNSSLSFYPLPNNLSLKGDWYLTIPKNSAAPEHALRIIKELTSHHVAKDRMARGVGLSPYKESYISKQSNLVPLPSTGLTFKNLYQILHNQIDRSWFSDYCEQSPNLSHILKALIQKWKSNSPKTIEYSNMKSPRAVKFLEEATNIWESHWENN